MGLIQYTITVQCILSVFICISRFLVLNNIYLRVQMLQMLEMRIDDDM